MGWYVKAFNELTAEELYAFEKLRIDTFVVEQGHEYHDLDAHDLEAHHVFLLNEEQHEALAYARIFQEGDHVSFGRVATSLAVRGQGFGAQLIDKVLEDCSRSWPGLDIIINAQQQVIGFYENKGFVAHGPVITIENTPHRRMSLRSAS